MTERYTADDHLRSGLAGNLTGTNWYLVLIPVNTGFLGRHGVKAVHLIGRHLHDARTAGVLGLLVSTPQSLATARALGRVPVFTTAVTGEFMRSASNLWLTQMRTATTHECSSTPRYGTGKQAGHGDHRQQDGESVNAIRSGGPCPSAHTPIRERYGIELTRDLMRNIQARRVGVPA